MTASSDFSPPGTVPDFDQVKAGYTVRSLAAKVVAWIDTCADYWAAASLYEQMSKLSDAELNRRGLSRATLAMDIVRRCDRSEG
jgi:hypothetical protein